VASLFRAFEAPKTAFLGGVRGGAGK